jgi:hypothetical protein
VLAFGDSDPVAYEFTGANLEALHGEVRDFWAASNHKPASSVFS